MPTNPAIRCEWRHLPAAILTIVLTTVEGNGSDIAQVEFFEERIRPVLVEHCYGCHSSDAKDVKAGLNLDSRNGLLRGGDSGPAVVPGQSGESLLMQALEYDGLEMPPSAKLPAKVIADFAAWIDAGAADPREGSGRSARPMADFAAARQFWSFKPARRAAAPPVRNGTWP